MSIRLWIRLKAAKTGMYANIISFHGFDTNVILNTHVKKGGKDQIAGKVKPLVPIVGRSGDGIVKFAPSDRLDAPAEKEADVDNASRTEASMSSRGLSRQDSMQKR
jgi:hypothetical protein